MSRRVGRKVWVDWAAHAQPNKWATLRFCPPYGFVHLRYSASYLDTGCYLHPPLLGCRPHQRINHFLRTQPFEKTRRDRLTGANAMHEALGQLGEKKRADCRSEISGIQSLPQPFRNRDFGEGLLSGFGPPQPTRNPGPCFGIGLVDQHSPTAVELEAVTVAGVGHPAEMHRHLHP